MNYLSVDNLSKTYGERILFKGISFGLSKGDKIALIANNGSGKSTLLKIVVGKDDADSGIVTMRNGVRVGYLGQEPEFKADVTIEDIIKNTNSTLVNVIKEYEKALAEQTENYNPETYAVFEAASHKMDELQAWDYDTKMKTILSKFGIVHIGQKISALSGGQKKRLALAILLLDNPDLIIMDEPTNHLDVEMIEWLEEYLDQDSITLLMVTHDRYFLDRVCNSILELTDGKLYRHAGNYSYFLERRAEREQVYNVDLGKTQKLMKHELEWMRKMPRARTTKSKSRIDAFYEIEEKAKSRKVQQELKLEVKMSRVGGKILELKKINKNFGDKKILAGFDYTFKNGERIGIIGKNGVGKSTFLNIIIGTEQPDSGKVNTGETIIYGYYSQSGIKLKEDKRVIEVVKDIAEVIQLADGSKLSASQFLQHFMFSPEMQYTFVSKLSGGEKRRLYLLTVLIKNPNFLILDEPTNDLDILTLNKLEEFLMSFGGCLLVVSHDRYFMDKLVDHLFVFEGDGVISDYTGTYTEYRNELDEKKDAGAIEVAIPVEKETSKSSNLEPQENAKKKLSYKEKLEFENLEKEIAMLESQRKQLELEISNPEISHDVLSEKSLQIGVLLQQIEEKTTRWIELSELI
ncbi:MAG: ABC-F family ATP-binding cassette domain-containing protein [Bacteroidetes bacterium]|nr:ABC-F family ATP-binding cassette domain-containing protein [Bacteroidota bacterium]